MSRPLPAALLLVFCGCLAAAETPPDAEAMALMMPGPEHAEMAMLAGVWDVSATMHQAPGQSVESQGVATFTMINAGRHLQQQYQGEAMGQPFTGLGIDGYDRATKTYTSIWIDSMGTATMVLRGTADDSGVVTMTGEHYCPMRGKVCAFRTVTTAIDDDHFRFEMYTGDAGQEAKMMHLEYSRRVE